MRVPLRWLETMTPLPEGAGELAHRLTLAGLEVTDIEQIGGDWDRVVVGRVLEVRPHPDADRLRLVTVDKGGERQTVVCGAPNVAAGQNIAFASEGAMLADPRTGNPRKLKKSRIRGVVSGGMVCSEAELGLADDHEGILVLETTRPPGTPLQEVLGDRVFVFDLTPNRADALSVLGVAREVSALTGAPLTQPDVSRPTAGTTIEGRASVEIAAPDLCRRFTLALIEDVKVAPSPAWMQERLTAAGMRPINNLVDITNYVMLELGQPVHAFDYDTVRDRRIIVRRAAAGETLTTLDGKSRELGPDRLVIADPGGAIALAGVMGGLHTEITDSTRNVLLEVANFEPASVRRTARAFDLFSDAARRFAWGLPPELPPIASARVCRLLAEHAGGNVAAGIVDAWPAPEPRPRIRLRRSRIPQVLGMEIPGPAVRSALDGLGFTVDEDEESLSVEVPYWRRDVRAPDDLVEEVARITGYDDLPAAPLAGAIPHHPPIPARTLRERVRDLAAGAALHEVQTYSLVSDADLAAVTPPERRETPLLKVLKPLGEARDTLRTSLLPGILRAAARNLARGAKAVRLFEVGRSYHAAAAGDRPAERERAVALIAGVRKNRFGTPTEAGLDFFDAKAALEHVLAGLRTDPGFRPATVFGYLDGRTAEVRVEGRVVGVLGQVHPEVAAVFGVEQDAFLWELDLSALLEAAPGMTAPPLAAPVPRFPAASEDFALLVGPDQLAQELVREVREHPLVVEARVFDDYPLDEPDAGGGETRRRRSLGIAVRYQAPNRTLSDNDIAKVRRTILKRLKAKHGTVVRERG